MKKKLLLLGIGLLTLLITVSMFAYGFTTDTSSLSNTEKGDFATVDVSTSLPDWDVFGSFVGALPPGVLFTITPHADWSGDMTARVDLANVPDLKKAYRMLFIQVGIVDNETAPKGTGYLTLKNGTVSIEFSQTKGPYTVEIISGYYISNIAGWASGKSNPTFLIEVTQR